MSLFQLKKLSMINQNKILRILGLVLSVLYPFCVFLALQQDISLRWLSLFLLVLVLSAFFRSRQKAILFTGLILVSSLLFLNNEFFLRLYPVCMSAVFCFSFWISLRDRPLITVFAEKMGQRITPVVAHYTRNVTIAWGIFMTFNTLISITTLFLPIWIWTLYNGLIFYILMGLMFVGEYLIRRRLHHESV